MVERLFNLALTTPPINEPVTVDEFKDSAGIAHDDDNALIRRITRAARSYLEQMWDRSFITTVYTYKVQAFATTVALPRPPLISIDSIKYTDTNDAQQTVTSSVYTAVVDVEPGYVTLASGQLWPTDQRSVTRVPEVLIQYQAGYGADAANVPEGIKQAIHLLAGHWYEHREAVSTEPTRDVALSLQALAGQFNVMEFV